MHSDVTVDLKTNTLDVHSVDHSCDWKVTLAYTGESTMTGARISAGRGTLPRPSRAFRGHLW
jgi:glucose-1-phosphate cytidylyltransferase